VTSQVFRSDNHALKVIVQTNIAPHNPQREAALLRELHSSTPSPENVIALTETFRDQEQQLVLVFPYVPLTLGEAISSKQMQPQDVASIFKDILTGLAFIHNQGIVHRDIKPSAVLLQSAAGPACISDFGTAWHPRLSAHSEPQSDKILDIGTGAYRAPDVLFGNKCYSTPVDMWALGVMLAEVISWPPTPPFESRPAHEDGSQLGLILSIFKTMGTPTTESWPEAKGFRVTPFELWTVFPPREWNDILPDVDDEFRDLVGRLVRFESGTRDTAEEVYLVLPWIVYLIVMTDHFPGPETHLLCEVSLEYMASDDATNALLKGVWYKLRKVGHCSTLVGGDIKQVELVQLFAPTQ
jgi:serine/threonine protein kinase